MSKPKRKTKGPQDNLYQRDNNPLAVWSMKFNHMGVNVQRSTKCYDYKAALLVVAAEKQRITDELLNPVSVPTSVPTLSQAIESVHTDKWAGNNDGRKSYNQTMKCLEILGDVPLTSIDTLTIRNLRTTLKRKRKLDDPTVNRYMAALRTTIRHAAAVCEEIRVPTFEMKKESKGRIKWYTKEEEAAILEYCEKEGWLELRDIIITLADTGFRASECIQIGKSDTKGKLISEVNLKDGSISSWINKAGRPRTIPMTARVLKIMEERGKVPFTLDIDQLGRRWTKVVEGMELTEDCLIHCWRHTCASRLLQGGFPMASVQHWLGHASMATTQRYAHLAPDAMQLGRSVLDALQ